MKIISVTLLSSFLLLYGFGLQSQTNRQYETNPDRKRANIWYFGQNAGINLNTIPPTNLSNGKLVTHEGCSSISDTSGKIIIYTDGSILWDSNHDTIESGFMGNSSSSQSALILKHPDNDSILYIITTPYCFDYANGIRYSKYDVRNNNISLKNTILGKNSAERVAAVYHQNKKDIWVVWHRYGDNCFEAVLLTKEGFSKCIVESCIGTDYNNFFDGYLVNQGQIKFNSDGSIIAQTIINYPSDGFEYFKFDNYSGKIWGQPNFIGSFFPTSIEFSPNSDYIVVASRDSSLIAYSFFNKTKKTICSIHSSGNNIPYVQRGANNDIICAIRDSSKIGRVTGIFNSITYNNNYLNLDSGFCLSGLPNFNQSYFYTPALDFAYSYKCIDNSIDLEARDTFNPDSVNWVIWKSSKPMEGKSSLKFFKHIFKDTGKYNIQLLSFKGQDTQKVSKVITVYPTINKNFLGRDTAYETGTSFNRTLKALNGMNCYYWYPDSSSGTSFNIDKSGIYVCRITSPSFCVVTDTIVIGSCINDLNVPNISRNRDTLYCSQTQTDSFVWFLNGTLYRITKQAFLALTDTGSYRVEIAKKGHCNRSSNNWKVNKLCVKSYLTNAEIGVYPNPANDMINVELNGLSDCKLELFNFLGQIVFEEKVSLNTKIKLYGLPDGVYLLRITNTEDQQFTTKIIKE